jgi:hypothetical protein
MMPDTVDMDKVCEGCLTHERHIENPDSYEECRGYLMGDTECPCQHCLIKVMCITGCDKVKGRVWL